jgi:hypothetical protein
MTLRFLLLLLSLVIVAPAAHSAEKQAKKQASDEEIIARLREHALKKRAAKAATSPESPAPTDSVAASIEQNPPAKEVAQTAPEKSEAAPKKENTDESPDVLPEIQVRKDRITELDKQVAKQNREIRREKQNTKPTALDETLNGPKTSKWLAIFGGQSSEDRANIARERVAMMEDERDLIEAIAQTEDPEEKALLQRTLDAMRAMRRDLEASLR